MVVSRLRVQGVAERGEWCLVKGYGPETYPQVSDFVQSDSNTGLGVLSWLGTKILSVRRWLSQFVPTILASADCEQKFYGFRQYMIKQYGWRPCKNMVTLSPQFVQYSKVFWDIVPLPDATAGDFNPPKMSSGFQGVVLALSLCKSVSIVGFNQVWKTQAAQQRLQTYGEKSVTLGLALGRPVLSQGSGYYYYKCSKGGVDFTERHPWDLEHDCLRLLKQKKKIRLT